MRTLLLAGCLLLLAGVSLAAPSVTAVRATSPVQLDGAMSEPAWQAAAWQDRFVEASAAIEGANPPAAIQTRFKVLYDDEALYVAVECDEPNVPGMKARYSEHDQDVYQDDCLEVFFDPAGEGRYYHHFVVNSAGAWYDDSGADYGLVHAKLWEFPLQVGVRVDAEAKQWRAELRLPFAAMNLTPAASQTWLFNVTRERYAGGKLELSTWSPLKGNFHAPRLFGKLAGMNVNYRRFAWTIGEPQVTVSGDGSGRHQLRMKTTIANATDAVRKVRVTAHPFLKPPAAVTAPDVNLAAGASATVELPALTLTGNVRDSVIQLNVLDAETQAPLKIAVKHLDSEYRPIAVVVTDPVYRNNIYASEALKEMRYRVDLAPDVRQQTARVVVSLENPGDPVKALQGAMLKSQPVYADALDISGLDYGKYILRARALDKTNRPLAETTTTIRKLAPARGSEVRIDRLGNIVVNGQPRVFIGWYGGVATEDPRPEVVALQDIQTPAVLTGADPTAIRKLHAEHGIYSIVSIEPGRLYHTFSWWRDSKIKLHQEITKQDAPSPEFLGFLKQLVDAVKDEPALLGYYLADEPEINDARSAYLEALYAAMQELDPYHPVMITNDTLDGIVTHGYRACDILNPDPYSPEPEYVPNFMKRCHEVMRPGQTIMITPWHSSGQAHFTTAWGTAPPYSYRTMRMQYLEALAYGCRGFTGYTSSFFMPEIELRYGLPHIWREVRLLEPATANPLAVAGTSAPLSATAPKVTADGDLISWSGKAGSDLYVILVNAKPGVRTVTVNTGLSALKSLTVVSEDRTVAVTGGSFTDKLAGGDARVYTTNAAAAKLPTVAQVEKELADRKAAAIKPGNLLHYSTGVRARASDGYYAPWFMQYYYYALNGITDDQGWCLSHTDKPAWLEITLPQAKTIGRVDIYSPNLTDYHLQFQAPDGTVETAELTGPIEGDPVSGRPMSYSFNPPILTLKLRITALAVRGSNNPRGANLAEIEAYEAPGPQAPTPLKLEAAAAAPAIVAPKTETEGQPVLWREDFTKFQLVPKFNWNATDVNWVGNGEKVIAQPQPGGGLVFAANSAEGYAGMSHFLPYNPEYRYFQVKVSKIEGEGYRWLNIGFGDSSGKLDIRTAVHANRPGLYTVDTHALHQIFAQGTAKQAYVTLFVAGSGKNADGTVRPGPKFTLDWMQLVRRPADGLLITMADGSPLPPSLKAGDQLLYRVFLEKPAVDVTVEALGGSAFSPILLNGEPYVQLRRVGAGDGREWAAVVMLNEKTTKFVAKGYPAYFRAVITGGALPDLSATMRVDFQ